MYFLEKFLFLRGQNHEKITCGIVAQRQITNWDQTMPGIKMLKKKDQWCVEKIFGQFSSTYLSKAQFSLKSGFVVI